jgi:maleamate amidohydrolase
LVLYSPKSGNEDFLKAMTRKAKDLEADYAAAGFDGALTPGKRPALILVDFARAYFDPACGLYAGVENVRTVAARLTDAARTADIPIVFTRVEYSKDADGGLFYRKLPALSAFDRSNPFGDFTPDLAPQGKDIVITKQFPSAFFGTDLADRLRSLAVNTLLIGGLSTSGCVRATALDALCHGFIPLVIEDACGDRDKRVHDANIFDLRAKYAEIVSSAWARNYLAALASS